ncbi:CRISPR-associated protein Cas4 [Parvularcula maris]|uniref:Dna2/Cas4 domain-containing protein n=1 Tax=Parvularcula maris TaxID=2965077 RepID=A0A9X2L9F0_9PROT|nr:PD-(D/E)XK nuclease family protein [Parvularcula maris]MCQ8185558.1 Dna2/Cas4 domain-containing protein [Parvularcula maris]
MKGDREPVSVTTLASLERCSQQVLFDAKYGERRGQRWKERAAEGRAVHDRLYRQVTATKPEGRKARPMIWILGLLALAVLAFVLLGGARASDTDALLPKELSGATLHQSEKSVVRTKPVHVRGRPDEVWVKDGRRYIVETKSRKAHVFASDRMQLAAYAYMLRGTDGPPLAAHAYMRFTGGEELAFRKIKLPPDDVVVEAHRRYQRMKRGREKPSFASQVSVCKSCGHRERCSGCLLG